MAGLRLAHVTWRRGLLLGAAALALGVVPASGAPPQTARFQGFALGGPFKSDKRFQRADEEAGPVLVGGMAFRGRRFARVVFEVRDGNLAAIHLHTGTKKLEEIRALDRFLDDTCKAMSQTVEDRTPSPLGTPRKGEKWDPVIVTHRHCQGSLGGVTLTAREQHSRASDFQRAELELTIEAPPAAPPATP